MTPLAPALSRALVRWTVGSAGLALAVLTAALVAARAVPVRAAVPDAQAFVAGGPGAAAPPAAQPAADAARPAGALAPATAGYDGRLGAFVTVADACSYYPFTTCGGTEIHVSEATPGALARYVGLDIHIDTETRVCGTSIAGRPLDGPVVVRVTFTGPCGPAIRPQPCPRLAGRVPAAAIQSGLAEPGAVLGYGDLCNNAVPFGPLNPRRAWLTLRNPAAPYHPQFNGLEFKCGCP